MSSSREYPRPYAHPTPGRPNRVAEVENRRSHAAIPVAVVVVALGLYLAQFTVLLPALFGFLLLWTGLSFLSTRLNPLSPHFYLTRKPSWSAVGVVFLGGFGLLYVAWWMWTHGVAPVLPHALAL